MSTLLTDIEEFAERSGMSPITLGRKALGDPHFVRDLRGTDTRSPRRVWPETEAKVRAFMAAHRPAAPQQVAA